MFNENLRKEAIAAKEVMDNATSKYDVAFHKFMESVTVLPIEDEKLWKFVAMLTKNLKIYPIEAACQNTFCYWDRNDVISVIRVVATLRKIKSLLYNTLDTVVTDKSDDSYGDFIDAFFLAGPSIVCDALNGKYVAGDHKFLKAQILDSCGEKISVMIWSGENYLMLNLEERAKCWIQFIESTEEEEKIESPIWYENF